MHTYILLIVLHTMNNFYTGIVCLNGQISIKTDKDFKSVIAINDIAPQTLLLVEHVLTGSSYDCQLVVRDNQYLFDQLFPRIKKWKKTKKNKDACALEKIIRNCFGGSCDNIIVGDYLSKFNHACIPNSVFFNISKRNHNGMETNYVAVFSTNYIKRGEEITINYGTNRGHDGQDDFVCQCGKDKVQRDKLCEVIYGLITQLHEKYREPVSKRIDEYEENSKKILIYQYLSKKGLIASTKSIVSMTKKCVDYLNATYSEGSVDDKKDKMVDEVNDLFFKDAHQHKHVHEHEHEHDNKNDNEHEHKNNNDHKQEYVHD